METAWNRVESRAALQRAVRHISELIDHQRVLPGEMLPAASDLALAIGVSRPVVLDAIDHMRSQGRLQVKRGRGGTRVARLDQDAMARRLAWFREEGPRILEAAMLRG